MMTLTKPVLGHILTKEQTNLNLKTQWQHYDYLGALTMARPCCECDRLQPWRRAHTDRRNAHGCVKCALHPSIPRLHLKPRPLLRTTEDANRRKRGKTSSSELGQRQKTHKVLLTCMLGWPATGPRKPPPSARAGMDTGAVDCLDTVTQRRPASSGTRAARSWATFYAGILVRVAWRFLEFTWSGLCQSFEHQFAVRHAQETPLSFDSRVDSFNSDRGSELRLDHKDQNNKGSVHKDARETPRSTRATNHQSPTPQEVNNGQVQDVIMSVVICDSVVHLSHKWSTWVRFPAKNENKFWRKIKNEKKKNEKERNKKNEKKSETMKNARKWKKRKKNRKGAPHSCPQSRGWRSMFFSDSVLRLVKMRHNPVESWKKQIQWYSDTNFFQRTESNWWKKHGVRVEDLPRIHDSGHTQWDSENFGRIFVWSSGVQKAGSSSCQCSTTLYGMQKEMKNYVKRIRKELKNTLKDSLLSLVFPWTWFRWPVSEKKCYATYNGRPNGCWDETVEKMMQNLPKIWSPNINEGFPRMWVTKSSCACDCGRRLVSVGAFFFLLSSFFLFTRSGKSEKTKKKGEKKDNQKMKTEKNEKWKNSQKTEEIQK